MTHNRAKTESPFEPFGIDRQLIACLEAFELWLSQQSWSYQYDSAKAAWMGAWFARNEGERK